MRPLAKALVPWNRGFRGLVPCLLLASCSAPAPVVLGSPIWPAKSWVFGVQEEGAAGDLQLTARADDSAPLRLVLNQNRARLHAVAYNVPLETLGLVAGPIEAAGRCERRCALTRYAQGFELQFDSSHATSWTQVTSVDGALLDAMVPDRRDRCIEGCMVVTATQARLPTAAATAFLLSERPHPTREGESESGLLGLVDGAMYRVGGPGSLERLCEPAGLHITAGDWDPVAGRAWIATTSGQIGFIELARAVPGQPCPFVATSSAAGRIVRVAVAKDAPAERLLVLSSTGALGRIEAGRYRRLGAVALRSTETDSNDGFLRDFGQTAYVSIGGDDIGMLRGDVLTHQTGFSLGAKLTQALSILPYEGRLYFGFLTYNLYVEKDGRIEPLDEGLSRQRINWDDPHSLAVLEGRVVVSLNKGQFGEWSSHNHYCPTSGRFSLDSARFTLNIKRAIFWGDADDSDHIRPREVYWIMPDRTEECGE